MPKTLPEGICNFPIRMTTGEHDVWGRFTYAENARTYSNQSIGDVMRRAMLLGLEQMSTAAAAEIRNIRRERLRARTVKTLVPLCVSLGLVLQLFAAQGQAARAVARRYKARRDDAIALTLGEWGEA